MINGIEILDPKTGEKMSHLKSQKCGMKGFAECLLFRWFLPIPAQVFPGLITSFLMPKFAFYRTNRRLGFFCDMLTIYFSLVFGVTSALSLFHPLGSIRYCDLEVEIQKQLKDVDEQQLIYFNKGL